MERKNRNIWIAVLVIAVVCCCFVGAIAAGGLVWFVDRVEKADVDVEIFDFNPRLSEQVEETFKGVEGSYVEIDNFAGNISIGPSQDNLIHIVATKRASSSNALDKITVSMNQSGDRVTIRTKKVDNLPSARVDLEITAPPGTEMDVRCGAGNVEVRDMSGSINVHSGAGEVDARGISGPIQLGVGAGSIRYEGTPSGRCRFETGAGEITLRLPANPNVRVDLGTGLGTVSVRYDVDGQTSPRNVEGVIGDGSQGSIYAHTGVGSVSVRP